MIHLRDQTSIQTASRLSGCLTPTSHVRLNPRVNSHNYCAVSCSNDKNCNAFFVQDNICKSYSIIISPSQGGAAGDLQVYTKFTHPQKDLLRTLNGEASRLNDREPISTVTTGAACWEKFENCWCNRNVKNTVRFDMGSSHTVTEVVITKAKGASNDYSSVKIFVGNSGTKSDPLFTDDLSTTPRAAERFSAQGNRTGRYLLITQSGRDSYVICACLVEAYGY